MARKLTLGEAKDIINRYKSGAKLRNWSVEEVEKDHFFLRHRPTWGRQDMGAYALNKNVKGKKLKKLTDSGFLNFGKLHSRLWIDK